VVDSFPGPFRSIRFFLEKRIPAASASRAALGAELNRPAGEFFERGTVRVDLGASFSSAGEREARERKMLRSCRTSNSECARAGATLEGIELKQGSDSRCGCSSN